MRSYQQYFKKARMMTEVHALATQKGEASGAADDEAAAPARDAPLRFEEGRSGVWLDVHSAIDHPKLSSWHECVLRAWRRAVRIIRSPTSGAPPAAAALFRSSTTYAVK